MSDEKFEVRANSGVVVGTIAKVGQVQIIGEKKHKKISIVVTTGGQWPQTIPIEFFGRNFDKFATSGAGVNDEVLIAVDLKGRDTGARVFGSNDGWAIKVTSKGVPPPPEPTPDTRSQLDSLPF